ncbi:response regulator [Paraburkholderia sp. BCC1884]|uniref:response regulator n=1 Tax=Paraburkholderia sp. BCC1884 TaxID=2562668 RepID=UPI0011822BD2|nr:response regulator transcription factor [Paraburkholderia sp. BCC1884]
MKFTVLLVDDHAVVRRGLVNILAMTDDFTVVGEAGDGAHAVELAREHQADLIMLDLLMAGMDAVTTIRALRLASPNSQIAVLTSSDDDNLAFAAIEAGAQSFLLKSMSGDALLETMRRIVDGEAVIHSDIAHRILRSVRSAREPEADPFVLLTQRELDVLRALAEGSSNGRIAAMLTISESTVKTHVGNVLAKLNLHDRTQAVAFAWRHGLVGSDSPASRRNLR